MHQWTMSMICSEQELQIGKHTKFNEELEIKIQDLGNSNQTLATLLKDVKLSAANFGTNSNSLQIKLDATLHRLTEKNGQLESMRSDKSLLENELVQKMQSYETTVTELRSEIQDIAIQLVEKEQEVSALIKENTNSEQKFAAALCDWNNRIKIHEEQITLKVETISQLRASVYHHEQVLFGVNETLDQKLAFIILLQVTSQQKEAAFEVLRCIIRELETNLENINSLQKEKDCKIKICLK